MKYLIDEAINLMFQYTTEEGSEEMKEQDSGASSTPSGGGGSTSVTMVVWADIVGGPTRGKANQIKDDTKWESGIKRGVSNQIW